MKKRFFLIAIAAVVAAAFFQACTSKQDSESAALLQEIAASAADVFETAASMSSKMTTDMQGSFSYGEETIEMGLLIDMDIESAGDPPASHISEEISLTYDGETTRQSAEVYSVYEDGVYYMYSNAAGSWEKEESEEGSSEASGENIFRDIAEGAVEARLEDEMEEYDGRETYVAVMEADGEYIESILSLSADDGTGLFDGLDYSDMAMTVYVYIYADTLEPAGVMILCDEMGEALFEQLLGSSGIETTLESFVIEFTYDSFNAIDEITVPEEVKSEAEGNAGESEDISTTQEEIETAIESAEYVIYDPETGELNIELTITIDGEEISIPARYSQMIEDGWLVDSSADLLVYANDYDLEYMYLGDLTATAYICNFEDEAKEYTDCIVAGLNIYGEDNGSVDVLLPDGICLSVSAVYDVLELYGKPTVYSVADTTTLFMYSNDEGSRVLFMYFDTETCLLTEIELQDVTDAM